MSITNRSAWVVQVPRKPAHTREFSFPSKKAAQAYCRQLCAAGLDARLTQLENSWQLRLRYAVNPVLLTFDSLEEAEKTQKQIESDRALSIFRDYMAATRTSFREVMERYRDEVSPGHKGAESEIYRINRLIRDEDFVEKPLSALTTEDLQDFIHERLTEVAPSTVDREIDVISQILRYASDVWKIAPSESPLQGLRRPKYFNERNRRLSSEEEKALFEKIQEVDREYLEAVVIVALCTAMRRSEILRLTWPNVDLERRCAHLPETKNGRARDVPLSARAVAVLAALPRVSEKVFDIGEYSVKKNFVLACKEAGVNDLHFHDLRHEAISRFAESGKFGLLDLQAISGHRDTRMLLRYTHLCVQQLAHKMDEIPAQDIEYVHKGRRRRARLKLEVPVAGVKPLRVPDPPASTRLSERADYAVNGNVIVAAFGSTRVAGGHR